MAARERQITVTLTRRVWNEFQRRLEASGMSGERGADSAVINDWLLECMLRSGSGDGAAPEQAPAPAADDDDDDFAFDRSKL